MLVPPVGRRFPRLRVFIIFDFGIETDNDESTLVTPLLTASVRRYRMKWRTSDVNIQFVVGKDSIKK